MTLPILEVVDEVHAHLADRGRVVVTAPTGSGKTTALAPSLLEAPWAEGRRVVLLEPRRVAARAAATFMAAAMGEQVGETVGLVTRDERRVSAATRLEVVTEGVLTRRLLRQPDLPGVACVVFDEFHERSVAADLALAMALDVADLRNGGDDLRLAVLSATLDAEAVAHLIGAEVVGAGGRAHPVEIIHRPPTPGTGVVAAVAIALTRALTEEPTGDILAFLPGMGEIRQVATALGHRDGVVVRPLHGSLPAADQDLALRRDPGGRRSVVLATDVAETSVTIEGITTVVDGGWRRAARFDPRTGMDRLETVRISRASADQRAGRAGRLRPGRCIRLWSEVDHGRLEAATPPAITTSDPASALLAVSAWGGGLDGVRLLDRPSPAATAVATRTLTDLGALDGDGRVTSLGHRLLAIPTHPRLAAMLVGADGPAERATAAVVAALVGDRDVFIAADGPPTADAAARVSVVAGDVPPPGVDAHRGRLAAVRREARRLARLVDADPTAADPDLAGRVLARAWPERVAARRGHGRFTTVAGRGVRLDPSDPLAGAAHLAVGEVDDRGADALVRLAAVLDIGEVRASGRVTFTEEVHWRDGDVVAERREHLGAVTLATTRTIPSPTAAHAALLEGVRADGLGLLAPGPAVGSFRSRVAMLHRHLGPPWPDLGDEALLADLEEWLEPFLGRARRGRDLPRVPLARALEARVGWDLASKLAGLAPTHVSVSRGRSFRLDYDDPSGLPVLAVKLQELFGATTTPSIAHGTIPVVVHLLSPAGRPVQVTTDLAGFWARGYPEVRRELRGRYPKHPWPEDPTGATPTAGTRRAT